MIFLLVVAFVVAFAPASFAGTGTNSYDTGSFNVGSATSMTVKTSKNVYCTVAVSGSAMPVVGYSLGCYHATGSRSFGTSSADQKLFYYDTTAQAILAAPTNPDVAPTWTSSSWKEL